MKPAVGVVGSLVDHIHNELLRARLENVQNTRILFVVGADDQKAIFSINMLVAVLQMLEVQRVMERFGIPITASNQKKIHDFGNVDLNKVEPSFLKAAMAVGLSSETVEGVKRMIARIRDAERGPQS